MRLKIKGTGSAVPALSVTNDDLAKQMDTSDEWIRSRTGIGSRRIAVEETTTSLAIEAGKKALLDGGANPEEIDLVIVATFTPDTSLPNTAAQVQSALGCGKAAAFDLNAACSGFLFALNTVQAYFSAGICQKALVIGAEVISKVLDWKDRSTCVLFGDGAGAVYVEAMEGEPMKFIQRADGSQGNVLKLSERAVKNPWKNGEERSDGLTMGGQEVFKFAVRKVPECILELLEENGQKPENVDWFLLHQANRRIIEAVAKKLKISMERFPMNMDQYGNTSAASIPLLLDQVKQQGLLKDGDLLMLSGFGAGLTWGAAMLRW